jgi:hypothetical protein
MQKSVPIARNARPVAIPRRETDQVGIDAFATKEVGGVTGLGENDVVVSKKTQMAPREALLVRNHPSPVGSLRPGGVDAFEKQQAFGLPLAKIAIQDSSVVAPCQFDAHARIAQRIGKNPVVLPQSIAVRPVDYQYICISRGSFGHIANSLQIV